MIVVDVGSARHPARQVSPTQSDPEHYSVERLVDEFSPRILYAFDPLAAGAVYELERTLVVELPLAAWTHSRGVVLVKDGAYTTVREHQLGATRLTEPAWTKSFRLARLVEAIVPESLILKLDCEGAEIALLDDLCDAGLDDRISLLLVEWHLAHYPPSERVRVQRRLRCPVRPWEF